MAQARVRRRAFSLTDLLVVGGFTVLLVPLALPMLRDAGEQTRVAECLSNLHTLMAATGAYFCDYDNGFPLVRQAEQGAVYTWGYGGKTNRDYWRTHQSGTMWSEVQGRPLNPYLLGARVEPDLVYPDGTRLRTEIPVLRCPSDRSSFESADWQGPPGQSPTPVSSYDDVGTSYQYNLHGIAPSASGHGVSGGLRCPWGTDLWALDPYSQPALGWVVASNALVREVLNTQAATYTFYLEDPMDWGLAFRSSQSGRHGQLNKHTIGYLDGHADYLTCDTRVQCGLGWESLVRGWLFLWNATEPPIPYGYLDQYISCNPPWMQ